MCVYEKENYNEAVLIEKQTLAQGKEELSTFTAFYSMTLTSASLETSNK